MMIMAVGNLREVGDVLVDHQNRLALRLEHRQAIPDFVADQRREAFGGFVEDQQPRIGHQRAADRQHLLLAAGQRAAHIAAALGEPRKQRVDLFERPRIDGAEPVAGGGDQILAHGQIGKYLATLGHEADAQLRNPERRKLADFALPAKRIAPARAGVSPMMDRMVVVLPMPLRPIRATISPERTFSDMPNSTWLRP